MTKKDIEIIANVIRFTRTGPPPSRFTVTEVDREAYAYAYAFADVLDNANPRFDRARFLKACGVES